MLFKFNFSLGLNKMNYCLYIYVNIGDDIKQFDFTDVTFACDDKH